MLDKHIWEKIESYDHITIFRHIRPDGDAYGSQIGLKHLILANFPNKQVRCLGKRSQMFEKLFDRMDEEVDDDFIASSLAVVLDTANIVRIDDIRYQLAKETIKIDHHIMMDHYGDIEWVDEGSIATSEMIVELAYNNQLDISNEAAEALFCGLVTDSGRFLYDNVDSQTFSAVAFLLQADVDMKKIYDVLYTQTEREVRFKGYCQLNFKTTPNGVAYMKIKLNLVNEYKVTPSYAAAVVNVLSNMEEYEIHVHFVEDYDGRIRVEFRSKELPVNLIASKHGGGGHRLAAGTIVDNWETVEMILAELDELCLRGE